jgi:hypothetical protein
MATRAGTVVKTQLDPHVLIMEWASLGVGDDGDWMLLSHYADKNVHVYGTFGGATVTLQGSNEDTPANPASLRDPDKVALALSSSAPMEQVLENPLRVRPVVTGGAGTSLTVRLVCRA